MGFFSSIGAMNGTFTVASQVSQVSQIASQIASQKKSQDYFQNTLGWDFDKVWVWDSVENRPALREVGVNAQGQTAAQPLQTTAPQQDMVDLLTQQIQANIWL